MDEENQGLLQQNPQDSTKRTSYSNWEDYEKQKPKTQEPSKLDAFLILILLIMVGLAGFGVVKHYEIGIPERPQQNVKQLDIIQEKNTTDLLTHQSAVQNVFDKINDGLDQIFNKTEDHIQIDDRVTIDKVIDEYIAKKPVEQFTNMKTEWDSSSQEEDIEKDIEQQILKNQQQQNIVSDLEELIIQQEDEIQIFKPSLSLDQYHFKELQNGIRVLFVESASDYSDIHLTITLQIGKRNDPELLEGLTELTFRSLKTQYAILVGESYTTFTIDANSLDDLTQKLNDFYRDLTKPIFLNIDEQAQSLYDDIILENKMPNLQYILSNIKLLRDPKNYTVLQVDEKRLKRHVDNFVSGDTLSIIVKSVQNVDQVIDHVEESQILSIINDQKFYFFDEESPLEPNRVIYKYKSKQDLVSLVSFSLQLSWQRFFKYLLPKEYQAQTIGKFLVINLGSDLSLTLDKINEIFTFIQKIKNTDESDLQLIYSQMLATEELAFNSQTEYDQIKVGINLFLDPQYALADDEESLPIFDKEEFDMFTEDLIQEFTLFLSSQGFVYNDQYENQSDDLAFIRDATITKKVRELIYDTKTLNYAPQLINKDFELPALSPFIPENIALVSVCDEPVYPYQGFGLQKIGDIAETAKESTFDGSRELKFEEVQFTAEFPMPDFTHNCELEEREAMIQLTPYQLASNVWWKPSKRGAMVYTGLFIEKPQSDLAHGKTMLKILQKYYTNLVKISFEQELLFGYEVNIKENINGLNIQMLSYSEKQSDFLDKVFELLGQNNESVFNEVKLTLIRDVRRFHDQKLSLLTQQFYLPKIMLRPINTPLEILAILEEVTYEQFTQFKEQLLQSKIQILNLGNILPQESAFIDSSEVYWTKTLNLANQKLTYTVQRESSLDSSNAIIVFYQTGLKNVAKQALVSLYVEFLNQQSLDYFGSSQQVQIKRRAMGCTEGMTIYLQGIFYQNYNFFFQKKGQTPQEANEDISKFLDQCNLRFNLLTDMQVNELVLETIRRQNEEVNFKQLRDEGNYIWEKIVNHNYSFKEVKEINNYLTSSKHNEIKKDIQNLFEGQISVEVYSQSEELPKGDFITGIEDLKGKSIYECFYNL